MPATRLFHRPPGAPEPVASSVVEGLARASLVGLACVLPFELTNPVATVGPLAISSVELPLYLTVGLWGVVVLRHRCRDWGWAQVALGIFAVVVGLSAITAPVHRAAALKFAARVLGGSVLAIVTADVVRTAGQRAALLTALALGAALSAALGIAELWWPAAGEWLLRFKTQPSFIGGWRRASGPFQYANTAAMYWEAALPLGLAVGVWWARRTEPTAPRVAATVAALVIAEAIVLSASRAGWWGALGAIGALAAIAWRRLPALRAPSSVVLAALVVLPFGPAGGLTGLRLKAADPRAWYRAEYRNVPPHLSIPAGGVTTVALSVRNIGVLTWPASGDRPVSLSYHWFDPTGEWVVAFEGIRSPLPHDVRPGEAVVVEARLSGAVPPGRYRLKWDLVHEHVTWFSALEVPMAETFVTVLPTERAVRLPEWPRRFRYAPVARPPRLALWRAALALWRTRPWLGLGPDMFRRSWGPYLPTVSFDDRVHANSLYVELLVTLGVAGLVAFLGVLLVAGGRLWRRLSVAQGEGEWVLAVGAATGLATFLVHGLVDYFLAFTPTYGLFWMLVGLAMGWRTPSGGATGSAPAARQL